MPLKSTNDDKTEKRDDILAASALLFAQLGFNGTSFGAVAQSASVTKALVQYHFATKDCLWRETVKYIWNQRTEALPHYLDAGFMSQLDDEAQGQMIRHLCKGLLRFTFANPQWVKIMYQEAAIQSPRLDWMIDEFFANDFIQGKSMIELAQARGLLPAVDSMNLLHIISGAMLHLVNVAPITKRVLGVDPQSEDYIDRYVDTLISMMAINHA